MATALAEAEPMFASTQEELEQEQREQQEQPVQICKVYSNIVGKRFYNETLNDAEIVYLVREPRNPYDSNAIKVESRNHQQVGHISAASAYPNMAACLSVIADYKVQPCNAGGSLEAVSIAGQNSMYTSVCEITVVSNPAHRDAIIKHLKRCNVGFLDLKDMSVHGQFKDLRGQRNAVRIETIGTLAAAAPASSATSTPSNYQQLSQDEVLKSLDALWDLQETELDSLARTFDVNTYAAMQRKFRTQLFLHQLQGLAWMLDREVVKSKVIPPFYEEVVVQGGAVPATGAGVGKKAGAGMGGKGPSKSSGGSSSSASSSQAVRYKHSLTNHVYSERPTPVVGGIVSDTMGMGKSAMVLALILCNRSGGSADDGGDSEDVAGKRKIAEPQTPPKKVSRPMSIASYFSPSSSSSSSKTQPTNLASIGATLIVCPLSVVNSWLDEVTRHYAAVSVNGQATTDAMAAEDEETVVKVCLYHGVDRRVRVTADSLRTADIVITTYDVLAAECVATEDVGKGSESLMQSFKWWR
jgi:SWI/SNF-related matrix-associated actin-dependent regulator of chromatin subfamily A3